MSHLITGGAGFIGCNLAHALLTRGETVTVFDNLSRPRTPLNLEWLQQQHGARLRFIQADIRDIAALQAAIPGHTVVYHLAGQVAVTTSVTDPRSDFDINALGTFNVLEAARLAPQPPVVFYASTNKVYGGMETVAVVEESTRYGYRDLPLGVPETQLLDFHSPYGCSKGAADQYVRDYARIYGLKTVVFRQSCLAAHQDILTPFGHKPIVALRPGDIVHCGRGWTRVRHVWPTGVKPVRRLTTMNGLTITLTPDHRMVRPHGLFTNGDFAYGDFLAVLPEARYAPRWEMVADTVLDAEQFIQAIEGKTTDQQGLNAAANFAEQLLPLRADRLLAIAELVGRLFAAGQLHSSPRQHAAPAYTVQYFGTREELQEITQALHWLGLPTSGRIEAMAEAPPFAVQSSTQGMYRLQQQSLPLFTLFELLGVPVGDRTRSPSTLPAWVMQGHRLVKRAFLRGLLGAQLRHEAPDAALTLSFVQSKDDADLEQGQRWVQQLRDLLAEFGLETALSAAPEATTEQFTVRFLGGAEIFARLALIGYAFSAERTQQLNAVLRWQWTHTAPEHFAQLHNLYRADGPLCWDSLALVEELGSEPVYDLEVEDASHLVIAGGVQVSNCIYGPRQFGVEDQGWAAHFVIAAIMDRPITIYGNGKQVRDMLYIDDLIAAYLAALERIDTVSGQIYNIGGGPQNVMSIWAEFGPLLERLVGKPIAVRYGDWRPGDQPVYISDISKAAQELGWQPQVSLPVGIERLVKWVQANRELF